MLQYSTIEQYPQLVFYNRSSESNTMKSREDFGKFSPPDIKDHSSNMKISSFKRLDKNNKYFLHYYKLQASRSYKFNGPADVIPNQSYSCGIKFTMGNKEGRVSVSKQLPKAKEYLQPKMTDEPYVLSIIMGSKVDNTKLSLTREVNKLTTFSTGIIGDNLIPEVLEESIDVLKYQMSNQTGYNNLLLLRVDDTPICYSYTKTELERNLKILSSTQSFKSYIIDSGDGEAGGGIGNLNMSIDVFRLCEFRFTFPSGYLDGLKPNNIAYRDGSTLVVHTWDIGVTTLYTDKGTITIRSLPGFKINPDRLTGFE